MMTCEMVGFPSVTMLNHCPFIKDATKETYLRADL